MDATLWKRFAKFDTIRGFEVLGTALATMNRVQAAKEVSASWTTKPPTAENHEPDSCEWGFAQKAVFSGYAG